MWSDSKSTQKVLITLICLLILNYSSADQNNRTENDHFAIAKVDKGVFFEKVGTQAWQTLPGHIYFTIDLTTPVKTYKRVEKTCKLIMDMEFGDITIWHDVEQSQIRANGTCYELLEGMEPKLEELEKLIEEENAKNQPPAPVAEESTESTEEGIEEAEIVEE